VTERMLVAVKKAEQEFYFKCSNPSCGWTYSTALHIDGIDDKKTLKAEAEAAFNEHACTPYQQPEQ
jgi:hypothetical protein